MGQYRSRARSRGQRYGPPSQRHALLAAVSQHRKLRLIAQCKCEEAFVSDPPKHSGRFLGCLVRVGSSPVEPRKARQPAQAQPQCALILQLPAQSDCPSLGSDCIGCSADRVTLHRTLFEEVGKLLWSEAVLMGEGKSKVRGCFTVRAGCRGVSGCGRCVAYERVYVAGLGGVMDKSAGVVDAEIFHS